MRIAIIEIMPKGHYTLVESVAKIFSTDAETQIEIFTGEEGVENLSGLLNSNAGIKLHAISKASSIQKKLQEINNSNFDRAYIITLDHYFNEFASLKFNFPFYLFIHNIYLWFDLSFLANTKRFIEEIKKNPKIIHYWFKRNYIQTAAKKKITSSVLKSKGKFIVLNSNLSTELSNYTSASNIENIPFSTYDDQLPDRSINNKKLRICIPGMLSVSRRDYFSVLQLLESDPEFYKENIQFDFLGGVSASENGKSILTKAQQMITQDFDVIVYDKSLVGLAEFDEQLSYADIVLGNMHVVMDEYNIYGKSKESGLMYTMAKAAKPGILPSGYTILPELKSSTIIFNNYQDLDKIIRNLISNKEKLDLLRKNARENSFKFAPEVVYNRLMNI